MIGYKVFNLNEFEVGKEIKEEGISYYKKMTDCVNKLDFRPFSSILAEIEVIGDVIEAENDYRPTTNHIRIIKEIPWYDLLGEIHAQEGKENTGRNNLGDWNAGDLNTGNHNTGNYNRGCWNTGDDNKGDLNTGESNDGDQNTGDHNLGNKNTGDFNNGNQNTGDLNSGHQNTGNLNYGDQNTGNENGGNKNSGNYNEGNSNAGSFNFGSHNTGNFNTGNWNAGDFNSCNYSTGAFCTKEPPFMLFNKPAPITREEFFNSRAYQLCSKLEKVKYDDKGGRASYRQSWEKLWNSFSDEEKNCVMSIPNFDPEIFKEITGIDITKEG